MSDTDKTSIDEKFLSRNDLFGLEFSSGVIFLQVEGWENNTYEPYTEINSISPQSNSGWSRLEDPDGDDILHIPETEEKVLHASIGQKSGEIRRYTNYPESENRLRTIPNLRVPRPSNGDDYGFIDGEMSPYSNPTDASELVIPPGVHLDFNFYNPDQNQTQTPQLNIKMREYNINVIRPSKDMKTVKKILRPGSPMPIYPVGSMDNQSDVGDIKNTWGVEPVRPSRLRDVGGGR